MVLPRATFFCTISARLCRSRAARDTRALCRHVQRAQRREPCCCRPRSWDALVRVFVFLKSADIRLVDFQGVPVAAHGIGTVNAVHNFADAVSEKPSGFHAAIQHALNLSGADAFLAGVHQVNDLQPQVQRQVRRLKMLPIRTVKGLRHSLHLRRPIRVVLPFISRMRAGSQLPQNGHTGPVGHRCASTKANAAFSSWK